MQLLVSFATGLVLGILIMTIVLIVQRRDARAVAQSLYAQAEQLRLRDVERTVEGLRGSFALLSQEALAKASQQFVTLAGETLASQTQLGEERLEGKKRLIDDGIERINKELRQLEEVVHTLEKDREQKFGQLARQLEAAAQETSRLQETAEQLRGALANSRARGQWGERMAEDVLRLAGFIEGINYLKQKTLEPSGTRPDFTFLLPQGLKINMDVKFPVDNYLRFMESEPGPDRERHRLLFLRDVRNRVHEVTGREYIDPEDHTVDFVLLFIPNEQVYGFIHENDRALLDEALGLRVVLCSPLTLYAVLAVIRQAVENFSLEQTASHILGLFGSFKKQWALFVSSLDRLGRRLRDAQDEYDLLITTRRRQLEKPLQHIEALRLARGIPEPEMERSAEEAAASLSIPDLQSPEGLDNPQG